MDKFWTEESVIKGYLSVKKTNTSLQCLSLVLNFWLPQRNRRT
jgi:hypothetical protein